MSNKIVTIEILPSKKDSLEFDKVIIRVIQKKGKKEEQLFGFSAADADCTVGVKVVE